MWPVRCSTDTQRVHCDEQTQKVAEQSEKERLLLVIRHRSCHLFEVM